ncbi:hypothetical protein C8A05DRAFT_36244 [Staphylotrichum tortipilum]|uniref:DUF788-domain-containing protein n=1 Tax=Staphylotrichum tortipilum TaxID=2831512 RepID=A0AAN6MGH2_9PEZI|nr:hypothetical protein C8A05DRAFT_36244 [Staphylotrichum longicolle]
MAQKARKDLAKSNTSALSSLHLGSLLVNLLFLLHHFLLRPRSLTLYLVLSIPSFFSQFTLERTGRPRYDPASGALKSAGEDLGAAGLTEYMFDVVWVTWAVDVLVVLFGDWAWFFWGVVPAYGGYKAFGMMGAARQMAGLAGAAGGGGVEGAPPVNRKQRRAA